MYESFMGYDAKTLEPTKQKYMYMGTYEKYRAKHPGHGYTDTLKPYQSLKLKQWQIDVLNRIDIDTRMKAKK